ncbi:uncharacterized protein CCOS01_10044, partial [Colletotrichum costaricense]
PAGPRPSLLRELYAVLNQIGYLESTVSDFAVRQVTQNGPQGEQPRPPANPQYHSTQYTTPYTGNFGRSLRHNHVPDHFYHLLTDQVVQDSSATDTSNLENSILLVTTSSRSRALSKKSQTLELTQDASFRCKLMYKKKLIIPPFLTPVIPSPSPSSSHLTHTTPTQPSLTTIQTPLHLQLNTNTTKPPKCAPPSPSSPSSPPPSPPASTALAPTPSAATPGSTARPRAASVSASPASTPRSASDALAALSKCKYPTE